MTKILTLSSLALACSLLSASSALALERAAPQVAQAEPDDEGPPRDKAGPGQREPGPREKAPRDKAKGDEKSGGGERGEGRGRDAGPGDGPPARAPRGKAADDDAPAREPPARARDDDAPPKRAAPPAASGDDGVPPVKKARPPQSDGDAVPAPGDRVRDKAIEKKLPPPPAPKDDAAPAPAPKSEPKQRTEPNRVPALKEPPPPAPKDKAPASEAEPKATPELRAPAPKAEPAPDSKAPDAAPKAPQPAPRGPGAEAPKDGLKEAPKEAPKAPGADATKEVPKDGVKPPADAVPPLRDGKAAGEKGADAATPSEVKDLKELKQERKERSEDGGKRVIIEEPDKRAIIKEGGRTIIRHDETERFRRLDGRNTRRERRDGLDISITVRPGGIEIFTETDDRGRPLRRYRRDRDGREVILYDNRDYYRRHRDGSFIEAIVDLPPPRISIPRERYILEYEEASDVDVYETLAAPPVEELDRTYSLEEVRRSPTLRDRMRRIDLDAINFEFGAWEVTSDQYPALERVARAIKRVIERNPNEVFLIEGHTDAVGSDEDNLSLSDRRAESVAIILTEEFAVPPENLTTQGYGEQYLKVSTEEPERQNRRVAVRRITPLLSRGEESRR